MRGKYAGTLVVDKEAVLDGPASQRLTLHSALQKAVVGVAYASE